MKQFVLAVFFFAGVCTVGNAQSFFKDTKVVSAGIGIGSSLGSFSHGSQSLGISAQYEQGVWEIGGPGVISLGGYVGTKGFSYDGRSGSYEYSQKWNYTIVGVRSAYHYNGINNEKFDVYGGLMLSYNILSYKFKDNGGNSPIATSGGSSGLGLTAYLGGRYFFAENFGAFAELGYGVSYLTLGLAYKF